MTEDEQDLRAMQAELLAAEQSAWEPRCVARAFGSGKWEAGSGKVFVFTMQVWIDLEAVESPFLLGRLPEAEVALEQFEEAFRAFGHEGTTPEACDGEELVLLGRKMLVVIGREFAMRVRLSPPEGYRNCGSRNADCGMGDWLPIVACLKTQLGFGLAEALALPVGQAFALIAAHRCNEGWGVAGETYVLRDVPEEEAHAKDGKDEKEGD